MKRLRAWWARVTGAAGAGRGAAHGMPSPRAPLASRASRVSRASAGRGIDYATSPLLASKTPPGRSRFVVLLIGLGSLLLFGRAAWVQVGQAAFLEAEGAKRFVYTRTLTPSRGNIIDRNGQVLATSVATSTVRLEKSQFAAATPAQRRELARALEMTPQELDERLNNKLKTVTLRRHLDPAQWHRIAALTKAQKIQGVFEQREFQRRYPEGEAAAHVVGYTDVEDEGEAGIERAMNDALAGQEGERSVLRNRLGDVIDDVGEGEAVVHGANVQLAMDAKIQSFAYQRARDAVVAHNARSASVVVLDAQRGEVLAMANFPGFDPNKRHGMRIDAMSNRALVDSMEPGSTMKPFTIGRALETRVVTPRTLIDTAPGRIYVTGIPLHDTHAYGTLSVADVLKKSSNVGTVKIAQRMDRVDMWDTFNAVGLGQKPQLEVSSATGGRLRAWKTWRPVEHATMSYGYGLSASVLQMAQAYTVFARDGDLAPLTMLKRPDDVQHVPGKRVFSEATAREVRQMLRAATQDGGTGVNARTPSYTVAGKTGTVRRHDGRSHSERNYRTWFVGLAPATAPRIVVAVMVDDPRNGKNTGGEVAAPVFSLVAEHALRMMQVLPDMDVQAQLAAKAAVAAPDNP